MEKVIEVLPVTMIGFNEHGIFASRYYPDSRVEKVDVVQAVEQLLELGAGDETKIASQDMRGNSV